MGQWGLWGTCPPPPKKKNRENIFRANTRRGLSYHKYHPIKGLQERRKLPQRGHGQSPGRKWILCIFQVRKKPPGTPFSVFSSDGGVAKRRGARENFSPFPLSRRAWPSNVNDRSFIEILAREEGERQLGDGSFGSKSIVVINVYRRLLLFIKIAFVTLPTFVTFNKR